MEATGDHVAVRWLTAFVDRPAATFDAAVGFWTAVTATTRSPWRGDRAQFATLVPTGGDAHLRVQRVLAGPGGTHVDLHVDDPVVAAARARALGATGGDPLALRSPAGLPFCLVHHCDERTLPAAAQSPGGVRTLADQVCIDVAPERFDTEGEFWSALTGWPLRQGRLPEFRYLERPPTMPFRILLQRLGDARPAASAHLDLSSSDADAEAARHVGLGATVLATYELWITLADPAGFPYCLLRRDPATLR